MKINKIFNSYPKPHFIILIILFCIFLCVVQYAYLGKYYYHKQKRFGYHVIEIKGVPFEMVAVKGGICKPFEPFNETVDSLIQHQVNDFFIGKTEVSQLQWKTIMGDNPSIIKGDNLPVDNVDYYDCIKFLEVLNQKSGEAFRLPTLEEWEYAAKEANEPKPTFYSFLYDIDDVAWYGYYSGGTAKQAKSYPIASKKPNLLGIYDMLGNVEEWAYSPHIDFMYAVRGGSWQTFVNYTSASFWRQGRHPSEKGRGRGLRLVLSHF